MMSTSGLQAKIGKEAELEAALQRLRGKNADISQEAADIRVIFY
jgi:SP family sugar porter-like MFS transporter